MIQKVVSNFDNLDIMLPMLDKQNILFYNNVLYISNVKDDNKNIFKKNILKIFDTNCFLTEIDENNLGKEFLNIQEWCKNEFIKSDLNRFQKENQIKINGAMYILNCVENELFKKEGSEANGC